MKVKNHFPFEKHGYHVIQMESEVPRGIYLLKLTFRGFFQSRVDGLFREKISRNGKTVFYAATQFQTDGARRAFPCFDEPALKTTFNISIAHRSDYIALCNMPIYKTDIINGQTIDYYGKTVLMPTYLLAFVVGDYLYVETISKNNIKMGYYSRPSLIDRTGYSLSVGGKIMTFFEDYLGTKYSLRKEDQVAVPGFGAGAMENWGLILYGEAQLLWDPKLSTEENKYGVVSIMSHEIAHQWFGNIVTCKWWNEAWLNEGFATFFEEDGVASAEPSINKHDGLLSALSGLLLIDAYTSSHPLTTPLDGEYYFSSITYRKGAFIIRMLKGFLGNDTFLDGLKIYLKRHAFASVESDDLWRALTEASCARGQCVDVKQIMDPWILQMGYPMVTFKRINSTHYLVSQSWFLLEKNVNTTVLKSKSSFGYSWVIPLAYAISNQSRPHFTWMNMSSTVIEWNGKGWIKVNLAHTGFYITNYEEENWKALAMQLNDDHTVFSSSDRAGLLTDVFVLARANKLNYSTAIRMTEYMTKETENVPWKVLIQHWLYISNQLSRQGKAYEYLWKYLAFLTKPQYEKLGFHDVGNMADKLKRINFLGIMCKAQVPSCINNATKLFEAWMKDPKANYIPPNLQDVVFFHGIAHGDVAEWEFLYSQYNQTKERSIRNNMLYGMSASRDPWILERFLSYILEPGKLHKGDFSYILGYIYDYNPIGSHVAWNFIRVNWDRLVKRFGKQNVYYHFAYSIKKTFDTPFGLAEVQRFFKKVNIPDAGLVKAIQQRMKWQKKNEKKIENVLEQLLIKNNQM